MTTAPETTSAPTDHDFAGITFAAPRGVTPDGDRPTTPTVKGVLAEAARAVDPSLAQRITDAANWRESYVGFVRGLTTASAATSEAPVEIARAGLAAAHRRMVHARGTGTEDTLDSWDVAADVDAARGTLGTRIVRGAQAPVTQLSIPYEGRELSGHDLERQLAEWVRKGVVEESCAQAVRRVIDHPEWLALPGHVVADVGAGAEMGPLEMLCQWGATVLAVDVPHVTSRIEKLAAAGAGEVRFPVSPDGPADAADTKGTADTNGTDGADIVANTAAVTAWIEDEADSADIVFGMHAYADSGMHIRLTMAADVMGEYLRRRRPSTILAYLATPTDAFVVPDEIVDGARRRWARHGKKGVVKRVLRLASGGQLFSEPYPHGSHVADCIVAQQGPNYAVAKRLQRWRAVAAEADGSRVSFNVAPATLTRSVTKNTVLRAVYGGAHHFGVEVFEPATSRALMAALLVHDVMRDDVPAGQAVPRQHPEELFSDGAAHGGLWRTAWAPRSALGVAAVLGAPRLIHPRSRRRRG